MNRILIRAALGTALAMCALSTFAEGASRNDYDNGDSWLCRPGRTDACSVPLDSTIVRANGSTKVEKWKPAKKAAVDCFYVYPTVSDDDAPNSDMVAGPEERNVVHQQFARFAQECRTFAPPYRQITLKALRAATTGQAIQADRTMAYNDVVDAWNHYLKNDNDGRGVVLIGHSQGSGMLMQLIRNEIEGKPVHSQIISALLIGTNVAVPAGKDVGGSFKSTPLCRSETQTGCVISYVTFRSTVVPPANSRFGRVPGENMTAACVNPAALGGGKADLHAYLNARGRTMCTAEEPKPWVNNGKTIETPLVSVPGLLTGECVSKDGFSYLNVTVNSNPADPRVDDIAGDVVRNGQVAQDWGLHLVDVNVAMGDLVTVVGKQSKAWLAANKSRRQQDDEPMRIAKPILLVTTPVGVALGLYEAYRVSPGLAFLMAVLVGFITVAIATVVRTIRCERRADEQARRSSN